MAGGIILLLWVRKLKIIIKPTILMDVHIGQTAGIIAEVCLSPRILLAILSFQQPCF